MIDIIQYLYEDTRFLKGLTKVEAALIDGEPHWSERVPIALVALAGAAVSKPHTYFSSIISDSNWTYQYHVVLDEWISGVRRTVFFSEELYSAVWDRIYGGVIATLHSPQCGKSLDLRLREYARR